MSDVQIRSETEAESKSSRKARMAGLVGVYRTDSEAELDGLLAALPLAEWLHVTVTPLEGHPNDPAGASR